MVAAQQDTLVVWEDESMHGCTSKAKKRKGIIPRKKRGENMMLSMKYIYFKTCTSHTAQWLLYKSKAIIRQKSNLSLGAVIFLFLLFPIVSCRGTVVKVHCVFGEYPPLRLYVRCQLHHSYALKVIIESHNVFKHGFTTKSSHECDDISPQ